MRVILRPAILAFIASLHSLAGFVHASPPPTDSVHLSIPFDHKHGEGDHPRSAAKRTADLNAGEPRTVRMIYFLPNDRPYRQEVVDSMKTLIKEIQTFYADQMEAHGYDGRTFRFETDAQDEPLVHRVDGQHPDGHYLDDTPRTVEAEIRQTLDFTSNVYFIAIDNSIETIRSDGHFVAGVGGRTGKNGGWALVPDGWDFRTATHELGHAFGLQHDFNEDAYIMSYGSDPDRLSACHAEFLAVHPYFNADVDTQDGVPPTIELLSSRGFPEGSETVPVRLEVTDPDGLHQVILFVRPSGLLVIGIPSLFPEVKVCDGLAGAREATIEFDYDGNIPSSGSTGQLVRGVHQMHVAAVDVDGNVGWTSFDLAELSPHHVNTLEGHGSRVTSVSLSPDGTTLSSASSDGTVRLWDVETGAVTRTFEESASSVAFSPDGTTLATGTSRGSIRIREVTTGATLATLEGHTGPVTSLSFSRDGTWLASGSDDHTVRVWHAATAAPAARMEGHTSPVTSVSFSPDGTLLASGSEDKTILVWGFDPIAPPSILPGHASSVTSVSFSPDGATVASGSRDGTIRIWDVETSATVATLEGHSGPVTSVSFSPGGAILASGSQHKILSVRLWDVLTRRDIATLHHTGLPTSVSFSADGTALASGAQDGTIELWDASEWTRPRPKRLAKVSGDDQQGTPGAALTSPLVVEVRDQYGNPLPDAQVTFAVTGGSGSLDGKFTIVNATTDDDGRAETILTLGFVEGLNTVGVSIAEVELLTFSAMGVGTPEVPTLEGGVHTWHLPDGTTTRLGRGSLSDREGAIAFSPDGQLLAVATGIGIWLYEAETAHAVALLPVTGRVWAVSFSPDGTRLASGVSTYFGGRGDSFVQLWDVTTREIVATLGGGMEAARTSLSFSRDGSTLASGGEGFVDLWDVATGAPIATFQDNEGPVSLSPDGSTLAFVSSDNTIQLRDVATGELAGTLEGHTHWVRGIDFSPDGTTLASASLDGLVQLWDVATGQSIGTLRHTNWVHSVAFSPDGKTLASATLDFEGSDVKLWDVAARTQIATLEGWPAHQATSVSFSPDGAVVASGSVGTVLLWDVGTGNVLAIEGHTEQVHSISLSPDGKRLARASSDGVELLDAATAETILMIDRGNVQKVSLSPDGSILATESHLWDVESGEIIANLEPDIFGGTVAFSADGTTLASTRQSGDIWLWDVASGSLARTLSGHSALVFWLSFSADGATLASGSRWDGTIRLWDVATGESTATLEEDVRWVSLSPDGTILAADLRWGPMLWDVETWTQIPGPQGNVSSMAFSPDGTILALAGLDLVTLWDVAARETIATLSGHTHGVDLLSFSPDGTTLASGARDGTVLLWDLQLLQPHPQTLTKLSGLEQQGPAGAQLGEPFVVEVRDQNGNPFPGATVTFAATAGDGTLSTTTATADTEGRAATTLTLGSEPGANTVEATVDGLEPVTFTAIGLAVPRTLTKVSGEEQEGPAGAALPEPFVIQVRDQNGNPFAGATVTFAVTAGEGTLSETTAATDAEGRATATLTLGRTPGPNTVIANVPGLDPVTFTATAEATPDFDGDGVTGFSDFFLFAEAFGGSDPRFDLDGNGTVDFDDFFLFAEAFGQPARAKLLALARERLGLPDGPQLQQNTPNPFNSGTVISWFQLEPGPARMEVFALTGQRVAVLHQGPEKAGVHRLRWDGRDDQGRPLASGVYVYRLVTSEAVQTRKLTLLR